MVTLGRIEGDAVSGHHVLNIVRRHQLLDLLKIRRIFRNIHKTGFEDRPLQLEGLFVGAIIFINLLF